MPQSAADQRLHAWCQALQQVRHDGIRDIPGARPDATRDVIEQGAPRRPLRPAGEHGLDRVTPVGTRVREEGLDGALVPDARRRLDMGQLGDDRAHDRGHTAERARTALLAPVEQDAMRPQHLPGGLQHRIGFRHEVQQMHEEHGVEAPPTERRARRLAQQDR